MTASEMPEFDNPPLVETVISLQFEPVQQIGLEHIGYLFEAYKAKFPRIQTLHPLNNHIERLGLGGSKFESTRLDIIQNIPFPRIMLLSEDDQKLLQIQQDRFCRNWRNLPGNNFVYPRYKTLKAEFDEDLEAFTNFVKSNFDAALEPNQCEVTYVNRINLSEFKSGDNVISSIFKHEHVALLDFEYLQEERHNFNTSYTITHRGEFVGRLHVSANYLNSNESDLIDLTLTARGRPLNAGIDGSSNFFNLGRKAIVNVFDAMTTDEAHKKWGKRN